MKKVKSLKGFVIAQCKEGCYHIYTKDEWEMGEGFRNEEFGPCDTLQEAIDWIG